MDTPNHLLSIDKVSGPEIGFEADGGGAGATGRFACHGQRWAVGMAYGALPVSFCNEAIQRHVVVGVSSTG